MWTSRRMNNDRIVSRRAFCATGLAGLSLLMQPAWAQEAVAPDAVVSAEQPAIDVRSNIEDLIRDYIEQKGLADREQRGEIAVLQGFGVVKVPANNPDWVKYRSLAYEQALKDAKAHWISQQNQTLTSSLISRVYQAANQDPPPYRNDDLFKSAKLAEVVSKMEALGTGYLDQALRDLGIDPAKYEKIPPAQRYIQLSDELRKVVTTRSVGDLVGLTVFQTFEGHDGKGNHQIGLVAVVSPKMKSFAQSVLRLRGNFPADKAKAQDLGVLVKNKEALLQDFGTRWIYDQNGLPALVSFYQWGLAASGNDPVLGAQTRDLAVKKATELADAQIAEWLAASATLTTKSETGERSEKAVDRAIDGYVSQLSPSTTLIDGLDEIFEQRAHVAHLTGLKTLTTWAMKHPLSNQMVVGVVRIWSAASESATRSVRDARPVEAPVEAPRVPSGPPGTVRGRDFNNADDF
jgi:hypothetical protein